MPKVFAIQLTSGPNVKVNLFDVKNYIEEIASKDSKMVVLPENFALMPENDNDYLKHSEILGDGPIQAYISDLAKTYKIWIVSETIPIKSSDKNRVMASTITYDDKGKEFLYIIKFISLMLLCPNRMNPTMSQNTLCQERQLKS